MDEAFLIQAVIVLGSYALLIFSFFFGWMKNSSLKTKAKDLSLSVSVLIACRNEEKKLSKLFSSLDQQDYPIENLQIIFVNDHSTDNTLEVLREFEKSHPYCTVIDLPDPLNGKKQALQEVHSIAKGELILISDADCQMGPEWISGMSSFYSQHQPDLLLGPVSIDPVRGLGQNIQKLEFMSLMASSMGSCGLKQPLMAHGPNIGISSTLYQELKDDMNPRYASGDDMFLLQAVKKRKGHKVLFLKDHDAIVRTAPTRGLKEFLSQRQRWASKSPGYTDPFLILVSLLVFLCSIEVTLALVGGIINLIPLDTFFILLGIKTIADFPLLIAASTFFRFQRGLWLVIPLQMIYYLYIVITACMALLIPFKWKSRQLH